MHNTDQWVYMLYAKDTFAAGNRVLLIFSTVGVAEDHWNEVVRRQQQWCDLKIRATWKGPRMWFQAWTGKSVPHSMEGTVSTAGQSMCIISFGLWPENRMNCCNQSGFDPIAVYRSLLISSTKHRSDKLFAVIRERERYWPHWPGLIGYE